MTPIKFCPFDGTELDTSGKCVKCGVQFDANGKIVNNPYTKPER